MKAKYCIGILSTLLLAFSTVKAQRADSLGYRNDDAKVVVNTNYDNYDYYFTSRINRFHRSYAAFNYYSPVFTDSYWYNYQPFSWGLSIYDRGGFGIGYSHYYPGYDYGYYDGYDPYYGSSYYLGYDPFFYNRWYSPVIFNFRFGNRWHNDYYAWNRHNNGYNDSNHHNSRSINNDRNNGYYNRNQNQNVNNIRNIRSNSGSDIRNINPSNARVNRRAGQSVNYGFVTRSSSSRSESRSSGSKSGSSKGKSSGRR